MSWFSPRSFDPLHWAFRRLPPFLTRPKIRNAVTFCCQPHFPGRIVAPSRSLPPPLRFAGLSFPRRSRQAFRTSVRFRTVKHASSRPRKRSADTFNSALDLRQPADLFVPLITQHGLRQSPGSSWNPRVQLDLMGSLATRAIPRCRSPHSLESTPLPHFRVLTPHRLRPRCAHRISTSLVARRISRDIPCAHLLASPRPRLPGILSAPPVPRNSRVPSSTWEFPGTRHSPPDSLASSPHAMRAE